MTRRTILGIASLFLVLSSAGLTRAAVADDAPATGTWTWTWTRQNGDTTEITLKLKQEGDKLTGTISGPGGNETEIQDGSVKNGEVKFKVEREFNGNKFVMNYAGKLEGDTIKGKTERTRDGETVSRDWEAKRAAK